MEYVSPETIMVTPVSTFSPDDECYNSIERPVPPPCKCNMGQARL